MPASQELKALVEQMPNPDDRQMYTKNIDKAKIEQAVDQIQKGGRENVLGLIDLLGEPGSAQDVKPHYALHCLGNRLLSTRNEPGRREFSETLAGELTRERSNYVKAFLCQELQWTGGKEAASALGSLLLIEELVEPAVMALVAIRDGAAEQFRKALPQASGKCRLNILQGWGMVTDSASVGPFREALADPDREIRLVAGWGLARLGDGGSAELLLKAADASQGWERIKATRNCLVLAEKLLSVGNKQAAAKIYQHLRDGRTDPSEAYIRDAAVRGLEKTA